MIFIKIDRYELWMSKGGSFARSRQGAIFFCQDRKKKRRSFAREEDLLPEKKFLGRHLPET